jgi:REP element-mobilizing transposase RayT
LHSPEIRQQVWNHIKENAQKKDIFIDFVNGFNDHCHCLVSFGSEQTISKVMQLIKGESAFWINKQKLTNQYFEWQDEYYAIGVSESQIETVRNYIKNQEVHHTKKTWNDEYEELIFRHGFVKMKDEINKYL